MPLAGKNITDKLDEKTITPKKIRTNYSLTILFIGMTTVNFKKCKFCLVASIAFIFKASHFRCWLLLITETNTVNPNLTVSYCTKQNML